MQNGDRQRQNRGDGDAHCMGILQPGQSRHPMNASHRQPSSSVRTSPSKNGCRCYVLKIRDNYYDAFELIPHKLRPLLNSGKVLVTNWHQFAPESPHSEGGQTYAVVDKGDETPDAFAKRVLGELHDRAPIMVLNDEGHHAYRPAPTEEKLSAAGEEGTPGSHRLGQRFGYLQPSVWR